MRSRQLSNHVPRSAETVWDALKWIALLCLAAILPSQGMAQDEWQLVNVFDVKGRQGVATNGEHIFVSGSKELYTYSMKGELLASNETALEGLKTKANHIGDISVHKGELYAGIEWFEEGRGYDIQIVVYDAKTLKPKRSIPWEPKSGQVEVSAIAIDAPNKVIWMTDWVNGNYIYRYDLEDGAYLGKVHLRPVPQWQQGIAAFDGKLFITADDGNADRKEHDNLWSLQADRHQDAAYVDHAASFDQFRDFGEIEGLDFNRKTNELVVLMNRGKRIVLGTPMGLYPGYEREIHELYVFRRRP